MEHRAKWRNVLLPTRCHLPRTYPGRSNNNYYFSMHPKPETLEAGGLGPEPVHASVQVKLKAMACSSGF